MSRQEDERPRNDRRYAIVAGLLAAVLAGAGLGRLLWPAASQPSAQAPPQPIVQIVRPQPGLPDLSDLVDRLCPSIAAIVAHRTAATGGTAAGPATLSGAVPGFTVSAEGWLLTAALPSGQLDAVFGDGRRAALTELRTDPVSGLAIVKAGGAGGAPLSFSDQAFPRVGQSGLVLRTPAGRGCSVQSGMIASDFLADGGGQLGYVRLSPGLDLWPGGMPLLAADGAVAGVSTASPAGAAIPAPIAAVIVDELIRNNLAPATRFGFRAIDYAAPIAARLGDTRSGAGVALVQADSAAARAGLEAGDIVIAVDDTPVSSASELNRALDAEQGSAKLTIARGATHRELTIARMQARPPGD